MKIEALTNEKELVDKQMQMLAEQLEQERKTAMINGGWTLLFLIIRSFTKKNVI